LGSAYFLALLRFEALAEFLCDATDIPSVRFGRFAGLEMLAVKKAIGRGTRRQNQAPSSRPSLSLVRIGLGSPSHLAASA
jgi:hypothetical protein